MSVRSIPIAVLVALSSSRVIAQQPPADPPHDMQHMHAEQAPAQVVIPASRQGSGTSWLPDDTPMYAIHSEIGEWMVMTHGNAFVQYLNESGDRGGGQFSSVNWVMAMAERPARGGKITLRGMASLEPLTVPGCGYPDLLATGELCDGQPIHDRQHPHDLFMEIAASYDHALTSRLRWQIYGGPVGEPALGPTAFPHRISAMPNALAPITHHWLDATHIAFGVVSGGIYNARWKAEGSVFNGREPDEHRTGFDFAALDSWSARLSFAPMRSVSLQVSGGHLTEAEAGHDGEPRRDVDRVTASATYHAMNGAGNIWATMLGWGRNSEPGGAATNALIAESSLTLDDRDAWFGRFELVEKTGHDLDLAVDDVFLVAKLQGGYTRYWPAWNKWKPGVGASLSLGLVSDRLAAVYGRRVNPGFGIFATIRPGAM